MAYNSNSYLDGTLPKALSEEETMRYFQLARNGDREASEKLKLHNLRLVVYIVNKSFQNLLGNNATWDFEDLVSIGTYGLIKAVETFNIEKEIKFATYATRCISNEILMSIRKNKNQNSNSSLNESISRDQEGNDLTPADILSTDEDIIEDYEERELRQEVREAFVVLNEQERKVITMSYGFDGEPMTQNEISKVLNISQSYISRIDKKARIKIRKYLERRGYIVSKVLTEEMQKINKMSGDEKSRYLAEIMIADNITIEQLSSKYNISVSSIKNLFTKYLKKSDEQLFNEVLALIDEQIQKLKEYEIQQKLRKQKAKESYQSNSNYNSSNESNQIVSTINSKEPVKMQSLLLSIFPNYNKEEISEAIKELPKEEREILLLRYPLEEGVQHSLLDLASQYSIKIGSINWKIKSIINHTNKILEHKKNPISQRVPQKNNKKSPIKKTESIFDLFPEHTEQQILEAINSLSEINRKYLELKYGLNGMPVTRHKDIALQLNIRVTSMGGKFKSIKNQLYRKLNSNETVSNMNGKVTKMKKPMNIFASYPEHTEEEVLTAINLLNENNNSTTNMKTTEEKTIFDFYPNYSEQEVLDAIDTLSGINKRIIELKYGLNGNEIHRTKHISELLGIEYKTLSVRIPNIRTAIAKRLKLKKSFKEPIPQERPYSKKGENGIYALFPNFTKEEIDAVFNELDEKRKIFLELRYGLNGNETFGVRAIAKALNCKQSEVTKITDYIINLMLKKLNNKKTDINSLEINSEIPQLKLPTSKIEIEEVDKELKENEVAINTTLDFEKYRTPIKKLIDMLDDPNEQAILLLRLGYIRNRSYTEIQISRFLNIKEAEVHEIIQRGLSNISGISTITKNGIESVKQQLSMSKELKQLK